jgi:hypothetical protein
MNRIILFALLLTVAPLTSDAQPAGHKFKLDIPAGEAAHTLQEYYKQTKIEMLFVLNDARAVRTQAVKGEFDASEALDLMLEGTPLTFEYNNTSNLIVIRRVAISNGIP